MDLQKVNRARFLNTLQEATAATIVALAIANCRLTIQAERLNCPMRSANGSAVCSSERSPNCSNSEVPFAR